MYVYAGIDEAGYGPFFGPLVVGRCVLVIPKLDPASADRQSTPQPAQATHPMGEPPDLWRRLSKAVCRTLAERRGGGKGRGRNTSGGGRIVVNDSKKLTTKAAGIKHLEAGCLAFAALSDHEPADVGDWLDLLGETAHRAPTCLPWYHTGNGNGAASPWQPLPTANTPGEIAIARGMLRNTCSRIGVTLGGSQGLGAAVVFEDTFNRMVAATRSKAAVSFTQVARHLNHIWAHFGQHHPVVIVDRQGGRTTYRELLALNFPEADITVIEETPQRSHYLLREHSPAPGRHMTIRFEVEAEQAHMPVALASMAAKYTRELLMARFNAWFTARCPDLRPTAGYGTDGQRFWHDIRPRLPDLGVDELLLKRQA